MSSWWTRKNGAAGFKISAPTNIRQSRPQRNGVVKTHYESKPVNIPADFLRCTKADAQRITVERVNFLQTPLPEYDGSYATVIDGVLTKDECTELLRLAQLSSPTGEWAPAMVNAGAGYEVLATDVRSCDRIIWDTNEMTKRIWDRCLLAEGIREELGLIEGQPSVQGQRAVARGEMWKFAKVNERMRFLRYGSGQYFKSHCDGRYVTPDGTQTSFYTLHLYLNDSISNGGDVRGGATTFHSIDMSRHYDVDPKMGRVLIFQHANLVHSGAEVTEGIKYTMRSDLMYEHTKDD